MSLCDTCPQPGHCCRIVHLTVTKGGKSVSLAEHTTGRRAALAFRNRHNKYQKKRAKERGQVFYPLPFEPGLRVDGGYWKWTCPNLNPVTGRCDDYENRPELCRSYQPKDDPLCVLHETHEPGYTE